MGESPLTTLSLVAIVLAVRDPSPGRDAGGTGRSRLRNGVLAPTGSLVDRTARREHRSWARRGRTERSAGSLPSEARSSAVGTAGGLWDQCLRADRTAITALSASTRDTLMLVSQATEPAPAAGQWRPSESSLALRASTSSCIAASLAASSATIGSRPTTTSTWCCLCQQWNRVEVPSAAPLRKWRVKSEEGDASSLLTLHSRWHSG